MNKMRMPVVGEVVFLPVVVENGVKTVVKPSLEETQKMKGEGEDATKVHTTFFRAR